jgi:hypothetical protein
MIGNVKVLEIVLPNLRLLIEFFWCLCCSCPFLLSRAEPTASHRLIFAVFVVVVIVIITLTLTVAARSCWSFVDVAVLVTVSSIALNAIISVISVLQIERIGRGEFVGANVLTNSPRFRHLP